MKLNRKRLFMLTITFLIVLVFFFLKNESAGWRTRILPENLNLPFANISKNKIREVVLSKEKISRVYKKNNQWFIKEDDIEFKANQEKISAIITAFTKLKKENIISVNKKKHQELGIDKQKIEIKENGTTHTLFIGNAKGASSNFVRLGNENEVFLAEGFADLFVSEDFRDLSLHLINTENKVTVVEIINDNSLITLIKTEDDWKINGKTAKKDRIDFYLNDLKTLKAEDLQGTKENFANINPALTVTVKENSQEKTVRFYPQSEEYYLAKVDSSDYDYIIPAPYVASLKKEEKDFLD